MTRFGARLSNTRSARNCSQIVSIQGRPSNHLIYYFHLLSDIYHIIKLSFTMTFYFCF